MEVENPLLNCLPECLSQYLVTEFLISSFETAFAVFRVCKTWEEYRDEAILKRLCQERFGLVDSYVKPQLKDWKWVAMSKMEFKAQNFTGVGAQKVNGGIYEGELVAGKACGVGFYKWDDATYLGEWEDGECCGQGTMTWISGHKYQGQFKAGKQDGTGVFHFVNGDRYEGEWVGGKRDGQGTFFWDSGDRYEGQWKQGHRDGKGKFLWANGDYYIGDWISGSREGLGILVWVNGERYEGEWKNDERTGQGAFIWNNGDIYEGEWKFSAQDGKGRLVWGNGNVFEGLWKDGNKFDGTFFEKPSKRTFHRQQEEENLKVDLQYLHPDIARALQKNQCSYSVTGLDCYFQYLYKTKDNDERTHGVCLSCKEHCLPYTETKLIVKSMFYGGNFFCDCGAGNLDKKCRVSHAH